MVTRYLAATNKFKPYRWVIYGSNLLGNHGIPSSLGVIIVWYLQQDIRINSLVGAYAGIRKDSTHGSTHVFYFLVSHCGEKRQGHAGIPPSFSTGAFLLGYVRSVFPIGHLMEGLIVNAG